MSIDPYNYPFPQRADTMSMSTINQRDFNAQKKYVRDSSFQKTDIEGTCPTKQTSYSLSKTDFTLSTFIEPNCTLSKKINKTSDPLRVDDIAGTHPNNKLFKTGRVTDPLNPVYKLPNYENMTVEKGRNFIRDTLKIDDITSKKQSYFRQKGAGVLNEIIPGTKSKQLAYPVQAVSRLNVKDINKDGVFQTKRRTNPLAPTYTWKDQQTANLANDNYGNIQGSEVRQKYRQSMNRPQYSTLNANDIEGAKHNSYFQRSYFMDKRRQIRDYMKNSDIENCHSSSLKKGISTLRSTNPLVPNYKLPGHSQPPK